MFASMAKALRLFSTPAFSRVFWRSIGLTLLLFAAGWAGLEYAITLLPRLGSLWVNEILELLAPVLTLVLLWFVGGPVTALFAGLFLDGLAAEIEANDYPGDPPAPGLPFWAGLRSGLTLTLMVLGLDLALLPLDFMFPGPAEVATLLGNGLLLGREYFELAALRHLPADKVAVLRQRWSRSITLGGVVVALMSMVPLLNLAAPLFGVAYMVHLFKRTQQKDQP